MGMTIGVLSDLHLGQPGSSGYRFNNHVNIGNSRDLTRAAIRLLTDVDLILLLGDLSDTASQTDYVWLLSELEHLTVPVFAVAGNHDIPTSGILGHPSALRTALASSRSTQVELLESEVRLPNLTLGSAPLRRTGFEYDCLIPDSSTTRMPDPGLRIWASHFPVISMRAVIEDSGWAYPGDLRNHREVADSLQEDGRPTIVLHGHTHARTVTRRRRVLQIGCAAVVEAPSEVTMVRIDDEWSVQVTALSLDEASGERRQSGAAPVLADAVSTFRWAGAAWEPGGSEPTRGIRAEA